MTADDRVLGRYPSEAHRDAPATGCPIPSLASDVPRQPAPVRRAFTDGVRGLLARIPSRATAHRRRRGGPGRKRAASRSVERQPWLYEVPERTAAWGAALAAGVDLISTDRLTEMRAFLAPTPVVAAATGVQP